MDYVESELSTNEFEYKISEKECGNIK